MWRLNNEERVALAYMLLAALLTIFIILSCSCKAADDPLRRLVWDGEQLFDDESLIQPTQLDDGMARFICADMWSQAKPGDRELVFDAISRSTTHYVRHQTLLDAHPEFSRVDGDTPSVREMRITADALTNPVVSIGHECCHIAELATIGVSDHSDPDVWGEDGGHDGPGLVGEIKAHIRDLGLGLTR